MSRSRLFLDSSALFAGVASSKGAARALLLLAEGELIEIVVCEQVIVETEQALARKLPQALTLYREVLRRTGLRIRRNPSTEDVRANAGLVSHAADIPILVAAMQAKADYFVTLNRHHFLDDPLVAVRSGLRIGTPGEALAWVRAQSPS